MMPLKSNTAKAKGTNARLLSRRKKSIIFLIAQVWLCIAGRGMGELWFREMQCFASIVGVDNSYVCVCLQVTFTRRIVLFNSDMK